MRPSTRLFLKRMSLLLLMIASGVICYSVCFVIFMTIGDSYFGDYEHFTQYPILILSPLVIGFFAPLLLVLWRKKKAKNR